VLDRSGTILAANTAWRDFAQRSGLALPNAGVGQNYLQYSACADEQAGRIIDGITQLLHGRVDCLSFIYPCHSPTAQGWFLMLGFPYLQENARAVLLHVDISPMMPHLGADRPKPVVLKDDFGVEPFNARLERMMETIERSIRTVSPGREAAETFEPHGVAIDAKHAGPSVVLSRRQRQVLELMAKGLSNIEIGRMLAISPNTVKIHVSGILARLGVPNRAQAIHWTLTRPQDEMRRHM
jgi:DNA-binding CsgD family transcriptional regulator